MPIITLHNRDWKTGVTVEAHQGMSSDPNQNQSLGTRRLSFESDWVINSGTDDVQYRRDKDPDHPENPPDWTEWTNISSTGGDQTIPVD
jgi:hypothetical protein